jgi:hypothetical protein
MRQLINIPFPVAASPRQFQKSHRGHGARQAATQRSRRPSKHHASPRMLAAPHPDGPPQLADQPTRFAGARFGLALRAVPSARHLRAVALRLCRAAAARSVPSVTKQTPQKTFRISCRRHPPLVAAPPLQDSAGAAALLQGRCLPLAAPFRRRCPALDFARFFPTARMDIGLSVFLKIVKLARCEWHVVVS